MPRRISSKRSADGPALDYRQIFDLTELLFVVLDRSGKIAAANKKTGKLLGKEETQLIGRDWFDNFLPKRDRAKIKTVFSRLVRGEEKAVEFFENTIIAADGKERLVRWHNAVLRGKAGQFLYSVSVGEDITSRVETERKLKQMAFLNQQIIDTSPVGIFIVGKDGAIEYANQAMIELSGTPKEKMIGFNLLTSPSYKKVGLDGLMRRALKEKKSFKTDIIKYRSLFGKKLSFRIFTGTPLLNAAGEVEKLILTIEDETKVKQKTDELEQFNQLMVGRELKMVELKEEIARLKRLSNKP